MSRKGNCMDNGAMENFFGRLKVELFYEEKFESVGEFIQRLRNCISYWNNKRLSLKLKGMSPVGHRTHSHSLHKDRKTTQSFLTAPFCVFSNI